PMLTSLTTSRTATALPMTSLIGCAAVNSRESPDASRPSYSFWLPDVADTQLLPPATDRRTVTPAFATSVGCCGGEGVDVTALGDGVEVVGATTGGVVAGGSCAVPLEPPPRSSWKAATASTRTKAAAIAAVQLGPPRSRVTCVSASKTSVADG